jgi:anti-sigma regulatory factor (Ser/Thr protein kinase)
MSVEAGAGPFIHEALVYDGLDDYLASTIPFIEEGLAADESVLVAVPVAKAVHLSRHVDPDTDRLRLVAMENVGHNPAWIIPVWVEFVACNRAAGRGVRGIGEPVWPDRTHDELVECQRHEALLNVAFAPGDGLTLLCPYDASALDPSVIDDVELTHPRVRRSGASRASVRYDGDVPARLESSLPPAPADALVLPFDRSADHRCAVLRERVAELAVEAGLSPAKSDDAVLAVGEAVSNSLAHGGGGGTLTMWVADDGLVCQITDHGRIDDPLAGRVRPSSEQLGGRGLWLIHQLSDLTQLRIQPDGQDLRLHFSR